MFKLVSKHLQNFTGLFNYGDAKTVLQVAHYACLSSFEIFKDDEVPYCIREIFSAIWFRVMCDATAITILSIIL